MSDSWSRLKTWEMGQHAATSHHGAYPVRDVVVGGVAGDLNAVIHIVAANPKSKETEGGLIARGTTHKQH